MTATAYYVLTTLGPHSKGDVITFSAEQLGAGIDIARLEALGALRVASGGEIARAMPAQVQAANLFGVGNFTTDATPTSGTSGTYATLAPYGAVLYDVSQSPPTEYVNTGTQQSPTWTAAGGASLPGVTPDGQTPPGIQVEGTVAQVIDQFPYSIFGGQSPALPSGTEVNLGQWSSAPFRLPHFVNSSDNESWHVPLERTYRYGFSIPILAGTTGGDIEVRALQDGSPVETWTFTLVANQKDVLNGFQADSFDPTMEVSYALYQNTGSTWNVNGQPLVEMRVI